MNTNLKEILKNGEEEFNPHAWESLAKKLDIKMPVNKPNYLSTKNIFIAGASALFIGSGIFFFMNKETTKKEAYAKDNKIVETEHSFQTKSTQTNTKTIEKSPQSSKDVKEEKNQFITSQNQEIQKEKSDLVNVFKEKKIESFWKEDDKKFSLPELNYTPFVMPKFESNYCQNEIINIYNSNNTNLYIFDDNSVLISTIHTKENKSIKLSKNGNYIAKHNIQDHINSSLIETKLFSVYATEEINFSIDENILYENGIPFVQLSSIDFNSSSYWSSNKGLIHDQNDKTKLTVFHKGNYKVSLTKKDQNNCVIVKTQSIEIKEDYNLLAPNAFIPTDLDPRNNKFMPFALTQRNLIFDLVILDPENGKIVFRSNTSENAWDGIDINSGQMVKSNKAFIWKVSLKNPLEGEKSEYTGTIVKL